MTNIRITVTESVPPTRTLARLKLWGSDAQVIADNYSVYKRLDPDTGLPVAQFSHYQPYMINAAGDWCGSWVSNDNFYKHDTASLMNISKLQPAGDLQRQMNWLMYGGSGRWGAVMFAEYPTSAQWAQAVNIRQIGAVYAGQVIEILDTHTFTNVTYNGKTENIPMSRIQTFDPLKDWNNLNATIVHEVTCVSSKDTPMHAPVGAVYLPLVFRHPGIWLMDRWLV